MTNTSSPKPIYHAPVKREPLVKINNKRKKKVNANFVPREKCERVPLT